MKNIVKNFNTLKSALKHVVDFNSKGEACGEYAIARKVNGKHRVELVNANVVLSNNERRFVMESKTN